MKGSRTSNWNIAWTCEERDKYSRTNKLYVMSWMMWWTFISNNSIWLGMGNETEWVQERERHTHTHTNTHLDFWTCDGRTVINTGDKYMWCHEWCSEHFVQLHMIGGGEWIWKGVREKHTHTWTDSPIGWFFINKDKDVRQILWLNYLITI